MSSASVNALTPCREHAEKGCCLADGPHHRWHWKYYFSMPGVEYVQLYLWILKDWSWSQLYWFDTGFVFGALALAWLLCMIIAALYFRIYSEAWIGVGVILWIGGNYIWMCGDMLGNSGAYDSDLGESFFEDCTRVTQILLTISTVWLGLYFFLVPFGVFNSSFRQPMMVRQAASSPPQRVKAFFPTFRDYETFHILFWSMKDCLWVWHQPVGYMIVFGVVVLLNIDLMVLLATYKDQYIDFIHCLIILLWVVANGFWAYSELFMEEDATDEEWEQYSFLGNEADVFKFRNATGWTFFTAVIVLGLFYIQWIFVTLRKSVPSFQEQFQKELEVAGLSKGVKDVDKADTPRDTVNVA